MALLENDALLENGERAVGEWLAQAHGTRYDLTGREPWVLFDIMSGHDPRRGSARQPVDEVGIRAALYGFATPTTLTDGPMSVEAALERLGPFGRYGSLDPLEGAVWRVERDGVVDFLVKYVRPDKVDGSYLDSATGGEPVWNWQPAEAVA